MRKTASRRNPRRRRQSPADLVLGAEDASLLDVLDELLNMGVVVNGDLVLGVAGVDLIYLRLSSLLCAIDRIMPGGGTPRRLRGRAPRLPRAR